MVNEDTIPTSTRVSTQIAKALDKAVKNGKAVTVSDYIRDAIRRALREDGLM